MGLLFRLLELLIVIVPVAGAIYAAFKAVSSARKQRDDAPRTDYEPDIAAGTAPPTTVNPAALWRTITRAIDEHSRTDSRWLDYELDPAKLLDFPLMTDLRDPLTERFHKAKIRVDMLRPVRAEDLLDDRESAGDYLAAVEALRRRIRRCRGRSDSQTPRRFPRTVTAANCACSAATACGLE